MSEVHLAGPDPSDGAVADLVGRLRAAGCVFAEDEARLLLDQATDPAGLAAMVDRRVAGVPLEHVLGWVEFAGLRLAVSDGVFVPRRRTELLARRAAAALRPGDVLVELCCGCGAVAAAVSHAVPGLRVHAVDIDPVAVRCARTNLPGADVAVGDLDRPLPANLRGRVDVLVANAPYVPSAEIARMPPEARDHEPRVALDGGADGLDVLRRVVAAAPGWLRPGGRLLFEAGDDQLPAAVRAVTAAGLDAVVLTDPDLDASGVQATRPG
ncbi:putative protein N(5)-glutamine methyltransferase [Nakamurella endophytica]|uniref:putative protein N(5)-glutamine methyltransferase n=1 Tax=Nakamurella endophytica TaxID=1748367 RepID=UPI001E50BA82|nr:putative protein N(5)-glutamine methyltransferase [Nakamurella endophytica]